MKFPDIPKLAAVIGALVFISTTSIGAYTYFAKDADVKDHFEKVESSVKNNFDEIKQDVALLGRSFQADQIGRQIDSNQERIWKIEDRLRERISPREKQNLIEQKRIIERNNQKLEDDKKNLQKQ